MPYFFNLVGFTFGNSGLQPPNVMSPPGLMLDWVLVACDLKLRESFGQAIYVGTSSSSHVCTCTLKWDQACRAYWLQSASPRAHLSDKKFLPGERGISEIVFSGEYTAILKYWCSRMIVCTQVASQPTWIVGG